MLRHVPGTGGACTAATVSRRSAVNLHVRTADRAHVCARHRARNAIPRGAVPDLGLVRGLRFKMRSEQCDIYVCGAARSDADGKRSPM